MREPILVGLHFSDDRAVLEPRGPLVAGGAAASVLRALMHGAIARGCRTIVLKLGGVSAIDAAGVGALVSLHTEADRLGVRLTIDGPQPRVARLLDVTRVGPVLEQRRIYELVSATTHDADLCLSD